MTLSEYVAKYFRCRATSSMHAYIVARRVMAFEKWAGKNKLADVLAEDTVNDFLKTLEHLSGYTVNKYRADILAIWRAAADEDLVAYPRPRRIRRENPAPLLIECFAVDEVRALVAAAESLKGGYPTGVGRRHYWAGLLRLAWDSGLRRGDCWRFDRSVVKPDGTFRIIQSKTRKPIRRLLRPDTLAAIERIGLPQPFEWLSSPQVFGAHFKEVRAAAGLTRGSFRWLRRGCGSHVEAEHPGAGHRALGNTNQVFNSHYNADLAGEVLMPPAI